MKSSADRRVLSQGWIQFLLLVRYLLASARQLVLPWRFFQLNAAYFNAFKGIYSKLDMDDRIPRRWRLPQVPVTRSYEPNRYPVFFKPEWGQNAKGIQRIDNREAFLAWRAAGRNRRVPYIAQEAAAGQREYEIYYLRSPANRQRYAYLSVTEVINSGSERYPVNSVHNPSTRYREVTSQLSPEDTHRLWRHASSIGHFRMARVAVKCDTLQELLAGNFKVVEINLFLPMPLVLLADNVGVEEKKKIIDKTMEVAARLAKTVPSGERAPWVFWRKLLAHYRVGS